MRVRRSMTTHEYRSRYGSINVGRTVKPLVRLALLRQEIMAGIPARDAGLNRWEASTNAQIDRLRKYSCYQTPDGHATVDAAAQQWATYFVAQRAWYARRDDPYLRPHKRGFWQRAWDSVRLDRAPAKPPPLPPEPPMSAPDLELARRGCAAAGVRWPGSGA